MRAKAPGPAMWKLAKGDSVVWILGTLHESPKVVNWDSTRFRRILDGANLLILPRVDTRTIPQRDKQLPASQRLENVVSAATYQRYQTMVKSEKADDGPRMAYKPAWAGSWLMAEVYETHAFSSRIVPQELPAFARAKDVAIKYIDRHTKSLEQRQYAAFDATTGEACLNAYLDGIDHDLATTNEMGVAWAQGDVATILAHHQDPAWIACILAQPEYARIYETYAVDDMVKATDDALLVPGKSVAVMPLSDLLRRDGILDRLRAQGVTITAPAE